MQASAAFLDVSLLKIVMPCKRTNFQTEKSVIMRYVGAADAGVETTTAEIRSLVSLYQGIFERMS